jgi:alkylhydroperoxidase family enzyme
MVPRIAPLPSDEWGKDEVEAMRTSFGAEAAERFLSTSPDAPRVPNVISTMMRHPALTGPFLTYNHVLLTKPAIGARLRELMILRVAWRTRCTYEWIQHARLAPRCEITLEEIEAIADGAQADRWTPLERDLLTATDQLIDHYRIDDETWARLAAQLDERQLIEVTFVVGTYTCLAMVFNSLGLELDPELDGVAAPPLPAP